MKTKPVSYYSHKADKLLQQLWRLNHSECEICGNEISCAHHYYPKSSAGNLRYCFLNLISICQGCHFRLHNGYPEIQNAINNSRGDKWLKQLKELRMIPNPGCNTVRYYKAKIVELQEAIKNFK